MKKFLKQALLLTVAIAAATFCLGTAAAAIGPYYSAIVNIAGVVAWFYSMYKTAKKAIDENGAKPPFTIQIAPPQQGRQNQRQRDEREYVPEKNHHKAIKKNLGKWGRKNHTNDYQRAA